MDKGIAFQWNGKWMIAASPTATDRPNMTKYLSASFGDFFAAVSTGRGHLASEMGKKVPLETAPTAHTKARKSEISFGDKMRT